MRGDVVYFTNVPTPYKTGMLDAISGRVPKFSVRYLAEIDHIRQWTGVLSGAKHRYVFLRSMRFTFKRLETEQYLSLAAVRACFDPNLGCAIFAPYSQFTFMVALAVCKMRRVRTVIWYESHEASSIAPGPLRIFARWLKGQLLRRADIIVVPGRMAQESALSLAVPASKIAIGPHAIDINVFRPRPTVGDESVAIQDVAHIVRRYSRVLLYVGQAVPRKNLEVLCEAFSNVQDRLGNCCLLQIGVPAGDAPHRDIYKVPFLNREDLVSVMNLAHGLILPSRHEVWGLVVNEAAACGLPVLVSDRCGASEMVIEGRNGFIFDPYKIDQIESALLKWAGGLPYCRSEIRRHSTAIYNFSSTAEAFSRILLEVD